MQSGPAGAPPAWGGKARGGGAGTRFGGLGGRGGVAAAGGPPLLPDVCEL